MIMDNSYDVDVEWMRQQVPGPSASRGFGGLRGRRRGSRGSPRRIRRRRGGLMAGDVEHMVVDADWAPHGTYHGHQDQREEYGHMLHDMQGDEGEYDPGSSPSGMFVRKRERTQNWSLQEKLLLFRLVAPRLDVLENRRIDGMSSARKGRAWREIHELFSARYGPERDVFRIREQWRRMKQAAKADVAGKNPQKSMQSPAAVAVAAAVAAATGQVHMPPTPALAQSLMIPPTAANLAAQQQQQAVIQQQQAAVAAAAAAATATTRNQMNSVLSDMIVKALEKVREREQEGGGPFDLSELDDGMGFGGFFSSGMAGGVGGNQQGLSVPGAQVNSQVDSSHGNISGNQGALSGQSDNNPSGSVTSSGGSNDAWRLTISATSTPHQQANNRVPSHAPDSGQHTMNNQSADGNSTKVSVKKEELDEEEDGDEEGEGDEDEDDEEGGEEGEWEEGSGSRQGRSRDGGEGSGGDAGGGGEEEGEMEGMVEPDVEMEEGKGTFMIMEMRRREHERRMQIMEREHELRCEVLQVEREAAIIRRETALSERERGWKTLDDFLRCVGASWPKENERKEEPLS
ncbi:uncharacterized protein [Hetaerina americana]|uniref:uncharacterized protein n=1 Tax=Hetaerina americana TaxID=62018 RepID=UPI003A7F5687